MTIDIGLATIEWLETGVPYFGKPMNEGEFEIQGVCDKFRVTTLDGLNQVFALVTWPNNKPEVNCVQTIAGQPKYTRLESAGRLGIFTEFEGNENDWAFEIRAMKYGGSSERPTLKQTTWAELDTLLEGQSVVEILKAMGAKKLGIRGDLMKKPGKRRNELMAVCEKGNTKLVAVAFTISRVLAVMKDVGN